MAASVRADSAALHLHVPQCVCMIAANVVTFSSPITEKHILHAKWQMASECVCARLIKGHTGSNGVGSP